MIYNTYLARQDLQILLGGDSVRRGPYVLLNVYHL